MIFVSMKNIMERPCSRQDFCEVRAQAALQLIELGAAHAVDLADTERDVAELELLVILIENFFRSLILEVAACGNISIPKLWQSMPAMALSASAAARSSMVQVGERNMSVSDENGAAQKTRDLRRNLEGPFLYK